MESNQPLDSHLETGLHISGDIIHYLKQCATWGQVMAIAGFIISGLLLIYAVLAGALLGATSDLYPLPEGYAGIMGSIMSVAILVTVTIILIPSIYLYRFASRTRMAILNENNEDLTGAIASLKSYFKFFGVIIIIYFGFVLLMFLIGGAVSMFG